MKKKLKKKLLQILIYISFYAMWTGILIFGFLQNTIY